MEKQQQNNKTQSTETRRLVTSSSTFIRIHLTSSTPLFLEEMCPNSLCLVHRRCLLVLYTKMSFLKSKIGLKCMIIWYRILCVKTDEHLILLWWLLRSVHERYIKCMSYNSVSGVSHTDNNKSKLFYFFDSVIFNRKSSGASIIRHLDPKSKCRHTKTKVSEGSRGEVPGEKSKRCIFFNKDPLIRL